jgi:hypothetical protein
MQFSFGQPDNGIIQTAYIVEDIHSAMATWVRDLNVGPWFLLESFTGEDPVYRGEPSKAEVMLAMAFAGHMMIELIQLKDEHPSVYREYRDTRGFGFHHHGLATMQFEASQQEMESRGYELAFLARVPTGDRVAYYDTGGVTPGFIELIEGSPTMDAFFGGMYSAAVAWDGEDPVRPFA